MRVTAFFVLVLAAVAMAAVVDNTHLRPNGSSTYPGDNFYLVCDSSDTFQVDTFTSDTFSVYSGVQDLAVPNWLNMQAWMNGFELADSANDSVAVIVTAYGYMANAPARAIWVDTFATTLDSTEVLRKELRVDSLCMQGIYFKTIVKDSFIMGAGKDSSRLGISFHIAEKR